MGARNENNEDVSDRELLVSREFNAPRELVWLAWTDPKHIAKWWGPRGFTTTIEHMDVREGGAFKQVMHGPDGADYPNKSVFVEVVRPERIAYKHAGGKEGARGVSFLSTWTFEELAPARTRVTIRMLFTKPEDLDFVLKNHDAEEGGRQTLRRLARHLSRELGAVPRLTVQYVSEREFVATRSFQAPRALVYKAYTDPRMIPNWWGLRQHLATVDVMDVRPGGKWRFASKDAEGNTFAFRGEYREVVPSEKLSWTFEWEGNPGHVSLETCVFEELDGETTITIASRWEHADDLTGMRTHGMEWGMNQSFDRLEETIARASMGPEFTITRSFAASPERLFELWTKPEHLVKWFGPKGSTARYLAADIHEGGMAHFEMLNPGGGPKMFGKVFYRELREPSRLVYVQWFVDEAGAIAGHPFVPNWPRELLTTVDFEAEGRERTKVTLRWLPMGATAEERETFDRNRQNMTQGWSGSFERLDGCLKA